MENVNDKNIKNEESGKNRQLITSIIVNIFTLLYGVVCGWTSPTIPLLENENSPLGDKPLDDNQIGWISGIHCLTAAIVPLFCITVTEYFGRKLTMLLSTIPFIIYFLLVAFARNYLWLLIARSIVGIGMSLCLFLVPIYVSEISVPSIRGKLGSIFSFCYNFGLVIGYVMGDILSYQANALVSLVFPLAFLLGFIFMPETPIYLVRKLKFDEATRSLMWLKNNDKILVESELLRLKKIAEITSTKTIGYKDLIKNRGNIRAFIIANSLISGQMISGVVVILYYTANIFEIAGSSLTPNSSAIVIGVIQLIASYIAVEVVERIGRRILLFISLIGMAITLIILGVYLLAQTNGYDLRSLSWIPIAALSIYIIVYSFGIGPVPYITSAEVCHPDVVSAINAISVSISWIVMFAVLKFHEQTVCLIQIHGVFFLYAAICILLCIFFWFFIPETKGRTLESILDELNGNSRKNNDFSHCRKKSTDVC